MRRVAGAGARHEPHERVNRDEPHVIGGTPNDDGVLEEPPLQLAADDRQTRHVLERRVALGERDDVPLTRELAETGRRTRRPVHADDEARFAG